MDSIEKLREKLPSLRAELKDDRKFSFFGSTAASVAHMSFEYKMLA